MPGTFAARHFSGPKYEISTDFRADQRVTETGGLTHAAKAALCDFGERDSRRQRHFFGRVPPIR
jgi:hypothetical protein